MLLAIGLAALGGWFSILCLSVYAHRSVAHYAVKLHPVVAHVMRFWLWFSTGTATRRWVAVHRKHHVYTDSDGDPHSPILFGLPRIFFFGYWYYRREAMKPETIEQYGANCPEDWIERNVYEKHDNLGLVALLVLDFAVFGWAAGAVAYAVQIIWVSLWAAGVINGIGHAIGYRNFVTQDSSRNIVPIALACSGEELHNNHHRWPRSAKFSTKWFEVDPGWGLIRTLSVFGLASDIYVRNRKWQKSAANQEEPIFGPNSPPESTTTATCKQARIAS